MSTSRTIAIVGVTAVLAGFSAFVMRKATKNSNEYVEGIGCRQRRSLVGTHRSHSPC